MGAKNLKNLKDVSYAVDPPIMGGESLPGPSELFTVFPRFNESSEECEAWLISTGSDNSESESYKEYPLAEGDEVWCSEFTSIRDPQTGRESLYGLGAQDVYIISEQEETASPKIDRIPRVDENPLLNNNGCFFSSCVIDNVTEGADKSVHRYLYIALAKETDSPACIYDLRDPSFKRTLPFLVGLNEKPIFKVVRFSSNKRTHWAFLIKNSEAANVEQGVYVIEESVALEKERTSLSLDDFSTYTDSKAIGIDKVIIDDLQADYFYFDEENTGSYQLALLSRTPKDDPRHFKIDLLSLDSENKLSLVADYTDAEKVSSGRAEASQTSNGLKQLGKSVMQPFMQQAFQHKCIRHPNGSIAICSLISGLAITYSETSPQEVVMGGDLSLNLYNFDPVNKTFSRKCSAKQLVLYGDSQNRDHAELKNEKVADFPISQEQALCFNSQMHCTYSQADFSKEDPSMWASVFLTVSLMPTQYSQESFVWKTRAAKASLIQLSNYVISVDSNKEYALAVDPATAKDSDGEFVSWIPPNTWTSKYNFRKTCLAYGDEVVLPNDAVISKLNYSSLACDVQGERIVLGTPKLTQSESYQLISLYLCMPFDYKQVSNYPMVTISNTKDVMTGYHKSTQSTWNAGYTVSTSFRGAIGSLNSHYGQTWGGSKMHMENDQTNISVHVSDSISQLDRIQCYASVFYLWEYPVYIPSKSSDAIGYLTILIPDGFEQKILTADDPRFTYDQDYEIGSILTYINAHKPSFDLKNLWFERFTLTCTSDSAGGTTIVYNKSNSKQKEDSKTTDDSINAGASVSLGNGFFNTSVNAYYTKSNIQNSSTSTIRSNDFSINFQSGTVKDESYEYTITPVVYNQPNNVLMVVYDVNLVGENWKELYSHPDVKLFKVYPKSEDPKLNCFTRSIRFYENADKSVDIELRLFCNSYNQTSQIVCEVYEGMAVYAPDKKPDIKDLKLIGTLKMDQIEGLAREAMRLKNIQLSDTSKSVITVKLSHSGLPDDFSSYYWAVYPYDSFQDLEGICESN